MADLDDFFAKKDKKKKSKKGFSKANTEILAKNLEENDRREAKADEKATSVLATTEANKAQAASEGLEENDEEWRVYDEDKKDYSNLKIDTLKLEDDDELEEDEVHEINEEGEKVRVKKGDGGPWNKIPSSESASTQEMTDQERRESKKAELEASLGPPKGTVVGGLYVPPHMKNTTSIAPPSRLSNRRSKQAPDINSQVYFPSLSAAGTPNDFKESEFEEVRGGNTQHTKSVENPGLALGNKFSALRE